MLLEPGVYGEEFRSKVGPFGLHCGQMKSGTGKMYHNASWYNKFGYKVGWGDLSETELIKISKEIPPDELFIVLGEHDSYWGLTPEQRVKLPIDYMLEKYRCVVSSDGIHLSYFSHSSKMNSNGYKEASFAENSGEFVKIDDLAKSEELSEI
jgi:hypothetical protein